MGSIGARTSYKIRPGGLSEGFWRGTGHTCLVVYSELLDFNVKRAGNWGFQGGQAVEV